MSNITIKKAKIIKGDRLQVSYDEKVGKDINNVSIECSAKIHEDLRASFSRLDVHLAELCEQYDEDGVRCTKTVTSTGFSIGGSGDSEGISISGQRALITGKILNLTSPFEKWEDDEGYADIDDLQRHINTAKSEVYAYLFENKHAPEPQMQIEFNSQTEEMEAAEGK